jgi:cytochrome c peroxidase
VRRHLITAFAVFCGIVIAAMKMVASEDLDYQLSAVLRSTGFTGRAGTSIEARLGRPIDRRLANLGRLLFFDKIASLHSDNACAGCHSPTTGFADTQSIAIGIQNNNLVGRNRFGPRNQRRSPSVANAAFFPALMWNNRFFAASGDPFGNSGGFVFPPPEGADRFPPHDPVVTTMLAAQAHLPPTELVEVAGFTGTAGTIGLQFNAFDDGLGSLVPPPDASGFRNEPIRQAVLNRLNASSSYRVLFAQSFPTVATGGPIDFSMFGRAIAEFEFTLIFADAPIDNFARGNPWAMSVPEKKGALVFFGKGGCVACHNGEMFSDFKTHVIGVPQIAPEFGVAKGNVIFDGPGEDEDFGLEQVTGNPADRYKFRSSPLRNVSLQPTFFHNGSFTRLEDAIRHHLDVFKSAREYNPIRAGVDKDLTFRVGPIEPVLSRVDPLLAKPIKLTSDEFESLVAFVRTGLLDPKSERRNLCSLIPNALPSGMPPLQFQDCPQK